MISFISTFFLYLMVGIPLLMLILIPIFVYHKIVVVSKKYTLTKFLIAWPMAIVASIFRGFILLLVTFISFLVFIIALNMILYVGFKTSDAALDAVTMTELILYTIFLIRYSIVHTVLHFEDKEE